MPPKKQGNNSKKAGGNKSGNKPGSQKKGVATQKEEPKKMTVKEARLARAEKSLAGASGMARMNASSLIGVMTPETRMLMVRSTFRQDKYDEVIRKCRAVLHRYCSEYDMTRAIDGLAMASLSYDIALQQIMNAVQLVTDAEASGSAFNPSELINLLILGVWYKLNGIFNIAAEDRELAAAIAGAINSGAEIAVFDKITKKLNMHDSMYNLNTILVGYKFSTPRTFKPTEKATVDEWELVGEEWAARNNAAAMSEAAHQPVAAAQIEPELLEVPHLSPASHEEQEEEEYPEEEYYSEEEYNNNAGISNVRLLSKEKQARLYNKVRNERQTTSHVDSGKKQSSKKAVLDEIIARSKAAHRRNNTKLGIAHKKIAEQTAKFRIDNNTQASVLSIKPEHTKKVEKRVANLSAFKRLLANIDKTDKQLIILVESMLFELSNQEHLDAYIESLKNDKAEKAEIREKLVTFINTRLPAILQLISSKKPASKANNNNRRPGSSKKKSKTNN